MALPLQLFQGFKESYAFVGFQAFSYCQGGLTLSPASCVLSSPSFFTGSGAAVLEPMISSFKKTPEIEASLEGSESSLWMGTESQRRPRTLVARGGTGKCQFPFNFPDTKRRDHS